MKKIFSLLLAAALVTPSFGVVGAYEYTDVNIVYDGAELQFTHKPFIEDGVTYVPGVEFGEAIGLNVIKSADEGIDHYTYLAICPQGRPSKMKSFRTPDTPNLNTYISYTLARVYDEELYIPLRDSLTDYAYNVSWDGEQRSVYVDSLFPEKLDRSDPKEPFKAEDGTLKFSEKFNVEIKLGETSVIAHATGAGMNDAGFWHMRDASSFSYDKPVDKEQLENGDVTVELPYAQLEKYIRKHNGYNVSFNITYKERDEIKTEECWFSIDHADDGYILDIYKTPDYDNNKAVFDKMLRPEYYLTSPDYDYSELVKEICAGAVTDHDKALCIYDWLCRNVCYDSDLADGIGEDYLPNEGLEMRRMVCRHFARVYKDMLAVENIPCALVYGSNMSNKQGEAEIDHVWNRIYIDHMWTNVDVTQGTRSFYYSGEYRYSDSVSTKTFAMSDWVLSRSYYVSYIV